MNILTLPPFFPHQAFKKVKGKNCCLTVMARSWQNSWLVLAAPLLCFAIFSKATSASKTTCICILHCSNYFHTRISNFTEEHYQDTELYWYTGGEGSHLTTTAQLGLATLSQTWQTLSSISQCCCKIHIHKVFSDRLHKVTREMPSIIFIQLTSV